MDLLPRWKPGCVDEEASLRRIFGDDDGHIV